MNLKRKTEKIVDRGQAQRGTFNPHGTPLNIYNWWLDNSHSKTAKGVARGWRKENFCHYWRVVAIWAPLLWLGTMGARVANNATAQVIAAVLLLGFSVYMIVSIGVLVSLVFLLGFVFAVIGLAAILFGISLLAEKYWRRSWNRLVTKVFVYLFIALSVVVMLFSFFEIYTAAGIWAVLGVVGLVAGLVVAVAWLILFTDAKHERVATERMQYFDEHGYFPPAEKKVYRKSAFSKFMGGVGDFLVLIAQVIRVNKWKICPIVEIDQK